MPYVQIINTRSCLELSKPSFHQPNTSETCKSCLQGKHAAPKIVPRVLFELAPADLLGTVLQNPQAVLSVLVAEAKEQHFDGWVRCCHSSDLDYYFSTTAIHDLQFSYITSTACEELTKASCWMPP